MDLPLGNPNFCICLHFTLSFQFLLFFFMPSIKVRFLLLFCKLSHVLINKHIVIHPRPSSIIYGRLFRISSSYSYEQKPRVIFKKYKIVCITLFLILRPSDGFFSHLKNVPFWPTKPGAHSWLSSDNPPMCVAAPQA